MAGAMRAAAPWMLHLVVALVVAGTAKADAHNEVLTPCDDAKIQRWDGFTFGIAFSGRESFFSNDVQLSPCDSRLPLSSNGAQLAVFRPKVDEISLLTVNVSTNTLISGGGYMVAFSGRKYAARSFPTFVGNSSFVVTGFTLVLEFQEGTLVNLYWKKDGCSQCSENESFVCLHGQDCAIKTSSCTSQGGSIDCRIGIQLAFSGTDKHDAVLNSWYEVYNLRQYSLFGLFSNLKGSLTSQFGNVF
ncbi:uncharacterized protein LOC122048785 [Zingiber officinale]|uniref:Expp1 protein n=1 Tax=Zingiber officinale TaxID=94328 RepID=A0A8J5LX62_ZINOF|nr:uncharacterized protein LOC122048785 [Zingiber officinale]KAG6526261.1 hypothetical protein ZIOFF_016243 [Zingiber officinale]